MQSKKPRLFFRISQFTLGIYLLIAVTNYSFAQAISLPDDSKCDQTDNALRLIYLGNTTFVFCDGTSSLIIDGFVSRPSLSEVIFGYDKNKHRRIVEDTFEGLGFKKIHSEANKPNLDALVTFHAHFDHAMDAPIILDSFGAKLIGSSSSHNLVKNYYNYHKLDSTDLNEQLVLTSNNEYQLGDMKFRLLAANHTVPKNRAKRFLQNLAAPLCPNGENCRQIKADTRFSFDEFRWTKKLLHGQAYNVLVRHKNNYFYFYNGLETNSTRLKNILDETEIADQRRSIQVFIAIPAYQTLISSGSANTSNVVADFWAQFAGFSKVQVHSMHWDNFFNPIEQQTLPKFGSLVHASNEQTHATLEQHIKGALKQRGEFKLINKTGRVDIEF